MLQSRLLFAPIHTAGILLQLNITSIYKEAPMTNMTPEQMIKTLEESGDFKVLRKLERCESYSEQPAENLKRAMVLDVETTGFDLDKCEVIELAMVSFMFNPETGEVGKVFEPIDLLQQPSEPIPEEIIKLTGITNEMVAGKSLDKEVIINEFNQAGLIIAHNAKFDRPFVEKTIPEVADGNAWACSWQEVPWKDKDFGCTKLGCLLKNKTNLFFGAHRADADCIALLHLIATPFDDGTLPMKYLRDSAAAGTVHVLAWDSPFSSKDILKERNYRWNPGKKVWHTFISPDQWDEEQNWLKDNVGGDPEFREVKATERYK
jgi:DNA polymerase III subunit epsilon